MQTGELPRVYCFPSGTLLFLPSGNESLVTYIYLGCHLPVKPRVHLTRLSIIVSYSQALRLGYLDSFLSAVDKGATSPYHLPKVVVIRKWIKLWSLDRGFHGGLVLGQTL